MSDDIESKIEEAAAHAEALRAGNAEGTKPPFAPKGHPLSGFEGGDTDEEFAEPDQGVHDVPDAIEGVRPMVGTLMFLGTDNGGDFEEIIQRLAEIGERLGLFYFYASAGEMGTEHVVPGSPLHQQLTGRSQ
jgi:hypothetical protein